MSKNNDSNLVAYLFLALVLSYFIIHNIILVLSGIIGSLVIINRSYINKYLNFNKSNEVNKVDSQILKIKYQKKETIIDDLNSNLVEKVEELGYIPSITNNDSSSDKAA
tara:strand:+ start:1810 stop:2136 length:327 start_codon:yes stop_codon:yes gene_type:complete